jgi:hypothetical protein
MGFRDRNYSWLILSIVAFSLVIEVAILVFTAADQVVYSWEQVRDS